MFGYNSTNIPGTVRAKLAEIMYPYRLGLLRALLKSSEWIFCCT